MQFYCVNHCLGTAEDSPDNTMLYCFILLAAFISLSHFNLSFSHDLIFLVYSAASDILQRLSLLNKCSVDILVSKIGLLIVLMMHNEASAYRHLETHALLTLFSV
jgi:hypothetical protein